MTPRLLRTLPAVETPAPSSSSRWKTERRKNGAGRISFGLVLLLHVGSSFPIPRPTTTRQPRFRLQLSVEDDESFFEALFGEQPSSSSPDKNRNPQPPGQQPPQPSRIKAKFDTLFAGMPSMNDIMGTDDTTLVPPDASQRSKQPADDSWFAAERQRIVNSYDRMRTDLLQQMEAQRQLDPDSVPENADAMIQSILKQELDRELAETQTERSAQKLQDYEAELRSMTRETVRDEAKLQQLMDESEAEYQQWQASQQKLNEYRAYEQQQVVKQAPEVVAPAQGTDLDAWALAQLQTMAAARQDGSQEVVLDILQENMQDLQRRMAKESKKGSVRPETSKEWQMYRSIATRLSGQSAQLTRDGRIFDTADEAAILERLDSWKEYTVKEAALRQESGLARGPKLPFEWQEAWESQLPAAGASDKQARIEQRKLVNRMSMEALEALMEKSDGARREKLQGELAFLKSSLEGKDFLDIDESKLETPVDASGPVDLSNVFSSESNAEEDRPSSLRQDSSYERVEPPPTPNTPFFEDIEEVVPKVAPPSTPFFANDSEDDDDVPADDSKLGSLKEQKLRAMYRRAGARTQEEQDAIRTQWEDFQEMEQAKRDASGLSTDDESDVALSDKYDLKDVMKDDGDFDAAKVLEAIGPRPSRTRKDAVKPEGSDVSNKDVTDSMYRSISAVGGGRYKDDPEAKARQQASFEEFLKMQGKARETMDSNTEIPAGPTVSPDDVDYANSVIESLGPRPQVKKTRIVDERVLSDTGAGIDDRDDEAEEEEDEDDNEPSNQDLTIPEWLRLENEGTEKPSKMMGGEELEDAFDDDQYDHNMRQLAEYERRRAGEQGRQMGIDISDVLRSKPDDYADYKFDTDYQRDRRSSSWGEASFASRQRDLLEYRELTVEELNALMDHKESVYATGVSQYLPRINKPFKEFGAIFRLEGVLVKIDGLQLEAWTKVASRNGFKVPEIEDVRRAAAVRPEVAVREVFFWTDDFIRCGQLAVEHQVAFKEVFDAWMKETGIAPTDTPASEVEQGSLFIGEELFTEPSNEANQRTPVDEEATIEIVYKSWVATATRYGFETPVDDDIFRASTLSPDIATTEIFRWSSDPAYISAIVSCYRQAFDAYADGKTDVEVDAILHGRHDISEEKADTSSGPSYPETQYQAWLRTAELYGFEKPSPEEALAASVLNDPEIVIQDGFGWSSDPSVIRQAVDTFNSEFESMLEAQGIKVERSSLTTASPSESLSASSSPREERTEPSEEEIFEMMIRAWKTTAQRFNFETPTHEQARLAMDMDVEDAIRRVLRWSKDSGLVGDIASIFDAELEKESQVLIAKYGLDVDGGDEEPTVTDSRPTSTGPTADDVFLAVSDAWKACAQRLGVQEPDTEQVQFALSVGTEEAILYGFAWADEDEPDKLVRIGAIYREELAKTRTLYGLDKVSAPIANNDSDDNRIRMFEALPGGPAWVKSLLEVEMECGIISYLERYQVDILVEQAGLSDLIPPSKRVSASNLYNRDSYQMLGAALRLGRRPDHCVVFDTTPYASVAAHDVAMRSVALIGAYPRYDLLSADTTTTGSFEDLTAMNIRRLFGERVYDQPLMDMQQTQPSNVKPAKTKFYWEGDD